MKKRLLLITGGFPYGESERSFLEIEFKKLIQHFHVAVLAITNIMEEIIYPVDEAVQVYRFNSNRRECKKFVQILKRKEVWTEVRRGWRGGDRESRIMRLRSILGYGIRAEIYRSLIEEIMYRDKIDVIYTYWCTPATLAAVQIKMRNSKLKVFTRIHGYDLYIERTGKARWQPFRRYITDNINKVIFVCQYAQKYFINHWGKEHCDKCIVSYIGTKAYKRVPLNCADELSLVSCSNVIGLKRVHLIVDALALMPENYKISWTHIGGGELLEDIKKRAEGKLGDKSNITYELTGMVSNKEVEEIYLKKKAQLFITTSSTEGAPVSIEEAFAMGIPAIGTEVGGIPDLIIKEGKDKTGYLLPENPTPEKICEVICNFMELSDDIKRNLGQNAYERWKKVFDAEQNAEGFACIIEGMID